MPNILFVLLTITVFFCLIKNNKKLGFVGCYSGICTGILVYYLVVPFLVFVLQDGYRENIIHFGFDNVVNKIINCDTVSLYRAIGFVIIGFLTFHFAYRFRIVINSKNTKVSSKHVTKETFEYYSFAAKILLAISLPSLALYILGFGGLIKALAAAEAMRSFSVSISTYTNPIIALFKVPACFISISSYLWLYVARKENTLFNKLIFCISFFASIIYFLLDAGRMKLILYTFTLLYVAFRKRIKHFWLLCFILLVPSLGLIDSLNELFIAFQTSNFHFEKFSSVVFLNVIREFSYPFRSLLYLPEIVEKYGLLFFKNIVLDTVSVFPGIDSEKSYSLISEFFVGYSWRKLGGVPDDVLTYGYINLRTPGIVIIMWIIGKICYYCDHYLRLVESDDTKMIWGIILAGAMYNLVASADWSAVLFNNVSLTVPICIMLIDKKRNSVQIKNT